MSTEPTPAETPADDPYDLGDTSLFPGSEPTETPPQATPEASATPAPKEQPRGPDGRFIEPPKPEHPAELVEDAIDYGFRPDEIATMATADLRTSIGTMKRNRQRFLQRQQETLALEASLKGHNRPTVEPEPPVAEDEFAEVDKDPDNYIPAFKALVNTVRTLRKEVAELRTHGARQAEMTNIEKIDAAFAALPAHFHAIFGTGAAQDMTPEDKPLLRRRIAILNEAGVTLQNLGQGSLPRRIRQAAETLYPGSRAEPSPEPAPPTPAGRITPEEWNGGGLRRPTNREGAPEPKGPELAERNLRRKLGGDAVDRRGDIEITDGLLG